MAVFRCGMKEKYCDVPWLYCNPPSGFSLLPLLNHNTQLIYSLLRLPIVCSFLFESFLPLVCVTPNPNLSPLSYSHALHYYSQTGRGLTVAVASLAQTVGGQAEGAANLRGKSPLPILDRKHGLSIFLWPCFQKCATALGSLRTVFSHISNSIWPSLPMCLQFCQFPSSWRPPNGGAVSESCEALGGHN